MLIGPLVFFALCFSSLERLLRLLIVATQLQRCDHAALTAPE
jgi:hypothetical protein